MNQNIWKLEKAIAQAAWVADVIAAYQAQHEANRPAPTATQEPVAP
jgi:hypothetical protein